MYSNRIVRTKVSSDFQNTCVKSLNKFNSLPVLKDSNFIHKLDQYHLAELQLIILVLLKPIHLHRIKMIKEYI